MSHPVDPVPVITPWNFPLAMATRKLDPALAVGYTDILKPSKLTPLTALASVEACRSAGIPNGVVDVVLISSSAALTGPLLRDSRLRKLSFTESTDTGKGPPREIAGNVLQTSMELGGYAPFTVSGGTDLDHTVTAVESTRLRSTDEAHNAADRFHVSRELTDEFAARFTVELGGLVVDDGLDPNADIGPIITSEQRQRIRGLVGGAREHGAKVLTGGEDVTRPGYFYHSTVLTITDPGESVICGELFGPVVPVVPLDSEERVLTWANSPPVGLATHVRTGDVGRALRITERLEVDMTGINSAAISSPATPFGGIEHSGLDREDGFEDTAERLKTIYVGTPV